MRIFYVFIFLCSLFFTDVYGWKIRSGASVIDVSARNLTTRFVAANYGSDRPVAVETELKKLIYKGIKSEDTVVDNWVVIPAQFIIPPNDEVIVYVTYVGTRDLYADQKYQMFFHELQLPQDKLLLSKNMKSGEREARVQHLLHYGKSVYLVNSDNQPQLTYRMEIAPERKKILVYLTNEGTGLLNIRDVIVRVFDGDREVAMLSYRSLRIVVNQEVRMVLPVDFELPEKEYRLTVEYENQNIR